MAQPATCAVVGEALVDVVDDGTAALTAHVGGSPLNVAVGLARLGRPTALVARTSTDPLGALLRRHALASGVDLSLAATVAAPSTVALVRLRGGEASYEFGVDGTADFGWASGELPDLPAGVRAVHFGSLASWLPPGNVAIGDWVAALRAGGRVLVSYDPNVRPTLQPDPAAARTDVETSVRVAHVVKASSDDLSWLYPGAGPADVAARWLRLGAALVVITLGGDGCVAFTAAGDGLGQVAVPVAPATVVDTVGAGDSFTSGLLDGLAANGLLDPATFGALPVGRVTPALQRAAAVSALTCSRAGADPPWVSEAGAAGAEV